MSSVHSREYRAFLVRLRKARTAARLSQVETARQLGRPQSYVSKCETGERRVDVIELGKFATLYGKSIMYFVRADWSP